LIPAGDRPTRRHPSRRPKLPLPTAPHSSARVLSGLTEDVGEPLRHAIIVRRDLSPCVVSVNDATDRIPDGALLEAKEDNRTVTILELPQALPPASGVSRPARV
jgi:hypothetical protein